MLTIGWSIVLLIAVGVGALLMWILASLYDEAKYVDRTTDKAKAKELAGSPFIPVETMTFPEWERKHRNHRMQQVESDDENYTILGVVCLRCQVMFLFDSVEKR